MKDTLSTNLLYNLTIVLVRPLTMRYLQLNVKFVATMFLVVPETILLALPVVVDTYVEIQSGRTVDG